MMPRSKAATPDEIRALRRQLQLDVDAGGLIVPVAVRRMRQAMAMTQGAFAKTFGLTIRQVWELEAGVANPTAATLERLAKPFGVHCRICRRPQVCPGSTAAREA